VDVAEQHDLTVPSVSGFVCASTQKGMKITTAAIVLTDILLTIELL
jgi:hypothetical protein